jgi:2-C-methyl-D-erythritol 4-phosphate cytidylyltransferase
MGALTNKIFLPVGGKPVLAWSLEAFEREPAVSEVVLVAAASELEKCRLEVVHPFHLKKVAALIPGGPSRHDSEFLGLLHLESRIDAGDIGLVLIHDAVRPFAGASLIQRLIKEARVQGAAIPCVAAAPNLVLASEDMQLAGETANLYAAQTPQAFQAKLVLDAHRLAVRDGFKGTDTSSVVEHFGHPVAVVAGSPDNLKITTAADLVRAEQVARHAVS